MCEFAQSICRRKGKTSPAEKTRHFIFFIILKKKDFINMYCCLFLFYIYNNYVIFYFHVTCWACTSIKTHNTQYHSVHSSQSSNISVRVPALSSMVTPLRLVHAGAGGRSRSCLMDFFISPVLWTSSLVYPPVSLRRRGGHSRTSMAALIQ